MGDGTSIIETLILAGVAAFLFFRLRSVLGRRTGSERERPNPFERPPVDPNASPNATNVPPNAPGAPSNVQLLRPDAPRPAAPVAPGVIDVPTEDAGPLSLADAIRRVRTADPTFDEQQFLGGARAAFGMIVEAYAKGDTATLRPLLADSVYRDFAGAIEQRAKVGRTLETRITQTESVDTVAARVEGSAVMVTVKFITQQINVLRGSDGAVIEGDAEKPAEVVDVWTFARDTRSPDPNWQLVATQA